MSNRPVYIIVYNSPLFPAHWSMWIPSYDAATDAVKHVGKLIHVNGDAKNGFRHEFTRNYDTTQTLSRKEVLFLGWTDTANVIDGSNEGPLLRDATATDTIERWALQIRAPDPSLRSQGSSSSVSENKTLHFYDQ